MSNVTIEHTRACGYCRKGVKKYFDSIGIDWQTFIKEGVPEEVLLQTNNAMAIKSVEKMKEMQNGR